MTGVRSELVWGVKASLIRYVRRLDDGWIEASAGAELGADGVFHLRFRDQQVTDAGRTLAFDGSIHIEGHGGHLRIRLSRLRIEYGPDAVRLTAETEDPDSELLERRPIAALAVVPPLSLGERDVWNRAEARLTPAGAETLGLLQYYATQQVDDVSWSAPALHPHPLGSGAQGST